MVWSEIKLGAEVTYQWTDSGSTLSQLCFLERKVSEHLTRRQIVIVLLQRESYNSSIIFNPFQTMQNIAEEGDTVEGSFWHHETFEWDDQM